MGGGEQRPRELLLMGMGVLWGRDNIKFTVAMIEQLCKYAKIH